MDEFNVAAITFDYICTAISELDFSVAIASPEILSYRDALDEAFSDFRSQFSALLLKADADQKPVLNAAYCQRVKLMINSKRSLISAAAGSASPPVAISSPISHSPPPKEEEPALFGFDDSVSVKTEVELHGSKADLVYPASLPELDKRAPEATEFSPSVSSHVDLLGSHMASIADAVASIQIKLDTFDGNPLEYNEFIASFTSQVDRRETMSAASKFQFLISSLSGNAKSAVKCLPRDEHGYTQALQMLQSLYGKPAKVARAHLDNVCEGTRINLKKGTEVQRFYHQLLAAQAMFRRLEYFTDVNAASSLLKLINRLPSASQNRWRRKVQHLEEDDREATFDDVVKFVKGESEFSNNSVWSKLDHSEKSSYSVNTVVTSAATVKTKALSSCIFCKAPHASIKCKPDATSYEDRIKAVKAAKVCFRCFRPRHFSKDCRTPVKCDTCGNEAHHTLMHRSDDGAVDSSPATSKITSSAASVNTLSKSTCTLLQVVQVTVQGPKGNCMVNAMLDTGSQISLVCADVARQVGLVGEPDTLSVNTLAGSTKKQKVERVSLSLCGEGLRPVTISDVHAVKGLVLPYNPPSIQNVNNLAHLDRLDLSPPKGKISVLIGANAPQLHVPLETVSGKPGEPIAMCTVLGWTLFGGASRPDSALVGFTGTVDSVEAQWDRFWNVSSLREIDYAFSDPYSQHDRLAVEKLKELKLVDGHYSVGLLWKPEVASLPNNRTHALGRLLSLKRQLSKNDVFAAKYTAVMQGYIDQGFASRINDNDLRNENPRTWYLPHFPVLNPRKPDKLRIVFDAAAKFQGNSLNDFLMSGPDLLNSLLGCLLRFRQGQFAVLADIQSMYHMVSVDPDDRDALRFLWWNEGDLGSDIREFAMNVHVFGAICSPCCAISALRKVSSDKLAALGPLAANMILKNFYVDDLVSSFDDVETAKETARILRDVLASCGFRLTKWLSNSKQVINSVPASERSPKVTASNLDLEGSLSERALGVQWNVTDDCITFTVDQEQLTSGPTSKRGILSVISSMFNPDGFLSPIFLTPKLIMRQLWQRNISWDEDLPEDLKSEWEKWLSQITSIQDVSLPRCYRGHFSMSIADHVSLHIFCDASMSAFGVVAYIRFVFGDNIYCSFVVGKSRCAPIKTMTVPRLELQAAVLGVRMLSMLLRELDIKVDDVTLWSDSRTTLAYVYNAERRFHTFVANRVSEIRDVTKPSQWRFCPGTDNPADIASRGLQPEQLATSFWRAGPGFLWKDCSFWPSHQIPEAQDNELELKAPHVGAVVVDTSDVNVLDKLVGKYSSFYKLQRVVARLFQFASLTKKEPLVRQGIEIPLSLLHKATIRIVSHVQHAYFLSEITQLKAEHKTLKKCSLISLSPFLDKDGLLRVGGRLKHSDLDPDAKHPILIPAKSPVAQAIIRDAHLELKHTGIDAVVTHIRQKFWVPALKSKVKQQAHACIRCRELSSKVMQQFMSPLPRYRVTLSNAFDVCGVDYFGPFQIKVLRSTVKYWCCLFTCLTTRAVHLETASSLDTDTFICVLRRFQARRGHPKEMHSDNGTNFVGAEKELKKSIESWNNDVINFHLQQTGTAWYFNTPAASHHGGVWERLVQTVKRCLRAVLKKQRLLLEVFQTILAEVEFIVNSRPLTNLSDDPNDLAPLTPNDLLLVKGTNTLPTGSFSPSDILLRKRWRRSQALADEFWVRWRREYLITLQQRKKWNSVSRNAAIGDVVLVVDDNLVRGQYPTGVITDVRPGPDGLVRTAVVKTASNTVTRPVTKLCLLEAND